MNHSSYQHLPEPQQGLQQQAPDQHTPCPHSSPSLAAGTVSSKACGKGDCENWPSTPVYGYSNIPATMQAANMHNDVGPSTATNNQPTTENPLHNPSSVDDATLEAELAALQASNVAAYVAFIQSHVLASRRLVERAVALPTVPLHSSPSVSSFVTVH